MTKLTEAITTEGSHPVQKTYDLRFRSLVGAAAWSRLPAAIADRFSLRLEPGAAITYVGEIVESRRNNIGRLLAHMGRAIGSHLPLHDDIAVPAAVAVMEDPTTGGQFWTRIYGQTHGFPQIVQSSKRFAGPTGLEEYLGFGFGIALIVEADNEALRFRSDHYFFQLSHLRFRLPRWLSPGDLTIAHVDRGAPWFSFVLSLSHPLFGELINQTGLFREHIAQLSAQGERQPAFKPRLEESPLMTNNAMSAR
jgi:hypothetical protein